jgi:hypothetical protein
VTIYAQKIETYILCSLTCSQKKNQCHLWVNVDKYEAVRQAKELVHDNKQFRKALSVFLHTESFYTIEEYFSHMIFN